MLSVGIEIIKLDEFEGEYGIFKYRYIEKVKLKLVKITWNYFGNEC